MKMSVPILSVLSLIVAIGFSSCQKELSLDTTNGTGGTGGGGGGGGGSSSYYIKGKKDGVAFNYTANTMAKITNFGAGTNTLSLALIGGVGGTSLEGLNIGGNFQNGTSPEVGTYSEADNTLDYVIAGVYNPNSMDMVWGAGVFFPTAKPLTIKILTKTATEMTGTFEGAFYKTDLGSGNIGPEFILFTEGEFKLKIQ